MVVAPLLDPALPAPRLERRLALLVNPFYPKDPHASFGKHVLTPTLALTSVAAATPPEWRVAVWDENLLKGRPPWDPLPEVVGITVHLTFARRAYALADWYRARGSAVVLGGLHVLSCPDEAALHADALAIGDGVSLWPLILQDVENGRLEPRYHADYLRPYRDDPAPRRDLVPRGSFLTSTSLIATRGCHNRCGFCTLSTRGLHMPYHVRDVEQVVREFEDGGQPYAVFTDNNLGSRPDYLRSLCRGLRPLGRIWSAAVTLDVTDDPSLVREMALAGCTGVFVGFESLTDENLVEARKKTPRADDYARRVDLLHANGIQVNGSFVLGFDGDRRDVFARTAEWIEENRLECATFHILTPYPGTPLFRTMEAGGRLLHRSWDLYDTAHAVFRPRHMTPDELERGYAWLYERLFSAASIWRRRPEDARAVLPYLAMSWLYKRSNALWHILIRHGLVHTVWGPLVEATRKRHLKFRRRLAALPEDGGVRPVRSETFLPAGV
ncbi:MAG: B12-binding domain-containing radical SAM protein [Thermoanaerobaculia bacterium]|nr:B12-binding domain-containing radical SAM protein [Thermoanaerobaculia bacterium]